MHAVSQRDMELTRLERVANVSCVNKALYTLSFSLSITCEH